MIIKHIPNFDLYTSKENKRKAFRNPFDDGESFVDLGGKGT